MMRIAGLLVGILLLMTCYANAEFFKYKDSSGAVVITDKLENVPKKYRNQLKVVWDEELEAKDPLARRQSAVTRLREKKKQEQEQQQSKSSNGQKPGDGKRLVITVDESTGQLIRTQE
jgi:hypothetical protein